MSDSPHIDPERLAALLDGRLPDADAEAVRVELAKADDDTLAAYADAVAVSASLHSRLITPHRTSPVVVPITASRRTRRWITPSLAAAAVLVVGVLLVRRPDSNAPRDLEAYLPSALVDGLPPSALAPDEPGWSATRGADQAVSERGRAVRIGALLTDMEIAATRGVPTTPQSSAIGALLEDVTGGSFAASSLRQLDSAGDADSAVARRHEAGRQAIRMVDGTYANIGAWIEAARIAASVKDSTFSVQWPPDEALGPLLRDDKLDQGTQSAVNHFLDLYKQAPIDFTARRSALDYLLRFLAR